MLRGRDGLPHAKRIGSMHRPGWREPSASLFESSESSIALRAETLFLMLTTYRERRLYAINSSESRRSETQATSFSFSVGHGLIVIPSISVSQGVTVSEISLIDMAWTSGFRNGFPIVRGGPVTPDISFRAPGRRFSVKVVQKGKRNEEVSVSRSAAAGSLARVFCVRTVHECMRANSSQCGWKLHME